MRSIFMKRILRNVKITAALMIFFFLVFAGRLADQDASGTYPETEGILRIAIEDDFSNKTAKERYYLQQDDNSTVLLNVSEKLNINPGARIRLELPEESLNSASEIAVSKEKITVIDPNHREADPVSGERKIAVILANFTNYRISNPAKARVNNMLKTKLEPYFAEMSFGKATVGADVYSDADGKWFKMDIPATCDVSIFDQEAIAAADRRINFNLYKYIMIVFPNTDCPYGGIAYLPPGKTYLTNEGQKDLLVQAIPHDYILDSGMTVGIHEFGHNLGLRHASGLECGSSALGSDCTLTEYGDLFDVMGNPHWFTAHYSTYHKEFLGWIPQRNVQVVTSSGVYRIYGIEQSANGIQSLKIPREGEADTYYSIENRTSYGYDKSLPKNAVKGALIRIIPRYLGGMVAPCNTQIIDSHPNSFAGEDFLDAGYEIGQIFHDPKRGLRIKPVSKLNDVLSVRVTFYGPRLISPANGSKTETQLFTWQGTRFAESYDIQVSRSSDFSSFFVNTKSYLSKYQATGLPYGVNLYWRVKANYSFGSSDWSNVYSTLVARWLDK